MGKLIKFEEKDDKGRAWPFWTTNEAIIFANHKIPEDGKCYFCGKCYDDFIPLSQDDINRIDGYLKNHKLRATKSRIETYIDGKLVYAKGCPFRNNRTKECKIYGVRPEICSFFQCGEGVPDCDFDDKVVRSMRSVFFKDDTNKNYVMKEFDLKVYGREPLETRPEALVRKIKESQDKINSRFDTP